jgi:hypothetical protein
MRRWVVPSILASVVLIAVGCAGRDFVRPEADTLVLTETTYQEILERFGSPYREGSVVKNGVTVKTVSYAYSSAGGAALVDGVTPARALGLYFVDNRLVGPEFLSSYAKDHTDFDDSKVATIKKDETTRAQVVEVFCKPGGVYVYPLIKGKHDQAFVYAYTHTRGSAFNLKFLKKVLVVSYGRNGTVTDVEFVSSDQR